MSELNNDQRVEAAAKALEDWDFESFGNDAAEHFKIAALRALAAADAVSPRYERVFHSRDHRHAEPLYRKVQP